MAATLGGQTNPLLQKAVDDRSAHPWRYYRLDHDTMKRICDEQAAKIDALLAAPSPAVDLSALWGLVDKMRVEAQAHDDSAHYRNDPYDDVGYEHRTEANSLKTCADRLAALLPPRDTEKPEEVK